MRDAAVLDLSVRLSDDQGIAIDLSAFAQNARIGATAERLSAALYAAEVGPQAAERSRPFRRLARRLPAGRVLETLALRPRPRPPVVLGAGVAFTDAGPRPYLLALEDAAETPSGELVSIFEEPVILQRVISALGGEKPPADTLVLPIPPPKPQFTPGEVVNAAGSQGTLGARVTLSDGRDAILTAGHVADAGTVVSDAQNRLGDTVISISPTRAQPKAIVADVAVVVPHLPVAFGLTNPVGGIGEPEGGSSVTMTGGTSGVCHARVRGALRYAWDPDTPGQWGEAFETFGAFSAKGDSGAPVVLSDTDRLVGHLVGVSGTFCSYIQDIDYQLQATGTTLLLSR